MILKLKIAALILFICGMQIFAQGQKEVNEKTETVTVSGVIRIVGNMPFTEIVLTDANDNDWFFFGDEGITLKVYQKKQITVRGTAIYQDIILADGKKNGIKRTLKNIEVIAK